MRRSTEKKEEKKNEAKVAKPKVKRTTVAELRKEIDALKATNIKLLNEVGNLSAMYMNALKEKENIEKASANRKIFEEKESVIMATKRVIAFLLQTYGLSLEDLTH